MARLFRNRAAHVSLVDKCEPQPERPALTD